MNSSSQLTPFDHGTPWIITTDELRRLVGGERKMAPHRWFSEAVTEHTATGDVLWDVRIVAEILSRVSGFELVPEDVLDLIRRYDAVRLLEVMGKGRRDHIWFLWQRKGVGPRPISLGKGVATMYLRREVFMFARFLTPNAHTKGQSSLPSHDLIAELAR